jgi:hypothetical protein
MSDPETVQHRILVDTRRSQRAVARIRVLVRRGADVDGLMSEVGHTIVVSAHGALIALAMKVQPGEQLLVRNGNSGEEQESRVVSVGEEHGNQNQVSIEFTKPVPQFWHIDFPPADWNSVQD